ncbi:MAG: cysteine desulfurase [Lachnospiraceae bacterium]|nr:cysteine desulfurase [Lachnospiraceae bacterium]
MIYADNAATTQLDIDAFEAMCSFLCENYGNASQPYSFAVAGKKALKEARRRIACCIGAEPEEIFFTSGGTESNNWVIKAMPGDVITSVIEHHSVLNPCSSLKKQKRKVEYVPVSREGEINLDFLESHITNSTRLVSIMYANNEIGTIQPVKKIAEIAHAHGCLYHTDAVQAVGHVNIDVHELDVDFLSASAHKFNGPKGIGFLYIRKGINLEPYLEGGSQERGLRAGTENVAYIVAMAVALEKNCKLISENAAYIKGLERMLIDRLKEAEIIFLRNGSENRIPGNVSLSFPDIEGEMLLHRMDLQGICISTGSACDSVNTEVSHVIKAIGIPSKYAIGTIRLSLGKNNTKEEIDNISSILIRILKQ